MIKEAIGKLVRGQSLTADEAGEVMNEIMDGKATAAQLGAFITALSIKGETAEEISGLAGVMRSKAIQVKVDGPVLDVVGTGGDGQNTFNISTTAAIVAAAAGLKIAKHGNRAASSICGSADVLEKMGVKIDLSAEQVQKCIQEAGIGFMFAAAFHPAMKYAAGPRREIGIRSVFNILGPLTNPAHAQYQVIGVPNIELAKKMASAVMRLGAKHALIVHGVNGLDEISITDSSLIWEVKDGIQMSLTRINPEDFGLKKASKDDISGGTAEENARIIFQIFEGERGARRDVVVLNTAGALVAGERVETMNQGVVLAQEVIDRGLALAKLKQFIEVSRRV